VVGYHRVVRDFARSSELAMPSMLVSTHTFCKHLDWIGGRYDFVTLDELALALQGKRTSSRPVAAITFDDGYKDVYLNAFPILQSKGIPSAVFVVTDLVGTSRLQVHDELYLALVSAEKVQPASGKAHLQAGAECLALPSALRDLVLGRIAAAHDPFQLTRAVLETLGKPDINNLLQLLRSRISIPEELLGEFQTMNWDMLKQMVRSDVTVGSHTRTHALLANEAGATVREELLASRDAIASQLGTQVQHFAYPDGSFNAQTIKEAAAAGYRTAYTICGHRDAAAPLLTIPRKMLWENSSMNVFGRFSPAILSCQVNGIFDPARRCTIDHWA
jgi:peptidoglycan/xylan/chitin deacetylase (PgdA/CDA1 family)